jgi:lactate permease
MIYPFLLIKKDRSLIQIGFFFVIKKRIFAEVGFQRLNLRVYGYRFFNLNTMVMNLVLAIIPVLLLIILMAFFKMSGDKSSVISLVVTMLIAFFGFHFPVNDLLSSFLYGALKAVSPILIIILMAIFSYNVLLKTEKMEIIKQQFSSISTDKSIQVLLLTWGFGGLLEAMAGFGTAVAIPAAILVSLGFKPVFSATVSLIANSVATAFGAIGTPVLVLAKETNLDVLVLSANVVLQLSVLMFLIPFVLLFLTDSKLKSLPKNIFLSLLVGGVSLGSQYIAARYMGAESPAIIGSILSIIVIVAYGKLTASKEEKARKSTLKGLEVLNAWSIYLLILFLIVLTSPLFPGLRTTLENNWVTRISLPINDSTMNYTVSWLTHAGVLLFVGTFVGGLIQGAKIWELFAVLWNTVKQLKKTFITVICLVSLSTIMDTAGMISVIATALAVATGSLYPLFAPVIGCLGTFITGSDTSSNILFGKLQANVAGHIQVSPDWLSAANTVGATGGKIISPQSIAIATSAGNQQGKEGEILKSAIPYALAYVLITGVIVYIFS